MLYGSLQPDSHGLKALVGAFERHPSLIDQREQSIRNKKYIKITLLDKAEPIVQSGIRTQKQFAKNVFSGVTKEKIDMCKEVFNKICANADECLKKYKEWDDEK